MRYDGSLGGDLYQVRTQCMDVNAMSYRWSESLSKACQKCDMGEGETMEHVMLKYVKYYQRGMR
ncbi:hypothetical protein E2C01_013513 [Portunus trituberculatus]|uniref:Uncharacterized protein n=1 Tax=Portunus trituberculatus TaxID=210409 RepID=A0A5B7DH88_PORTR|nr:hypothetical protein [Portunus trituberculatus]